MRILALDLGKRRIGLAVSDELGITAQGLETLERKNLRADLDALARLAREFAASLEKRTGVAVRLWDERLTTREAARVLRSSGIGIEKRARAIDRLSAVILLQSYLDSQLYASPAEDPA
jgi:putative pre-16S rRNA nuclease